MCGVKMEDKMGFDGDPGADTSVNANNDFLGDPGANLGFDSSPAPDPGFGPGSTPTGGGPEASRPVDIPPVFPKHAPPPAKPQAEKKDAVKRKARKRSLLTGEGIEEQVYRRSILGG